MAGTFSQIYIHVVFAVKGRENLIQKEWKEELNKYIAGIITNKEQKSIIVNVMPDHIHVFIGLRPSMAIADLVRDIKNNSSNFINDKKINERENFMAGRVRGFFLRALSNRNRIQLHKKSRGAPQEKNIQRRIYRLVTII